MKKNIYLFLMFVPLLCLFSCENDDKGKAPTIKSVEVDPSTLYGDSIPFKVTVEKGSEALSSVSAKAYFGNDLVSETLIPTNDPGTFSGRLFIPYRPNMPEGNKVSLRFVVKDREFEYSDHKTEIPIAYPKFTSMNFETESGNFPMTKISENEYSVKAIFPLKLRGFFEGKTEHGKAIRFGLRNGAVAVNGNEPIKFQGAEPDECEVKFNFYTFEASPMEKYMSISFENSEEGKVKEINISQNQDLLIEGIDDYESWWINLAFFNKNADGTLTFKAIDGLYRITADYALKYLKIEPLNAQGELASFDPITGEGCIWINGNAGIGIPSYGSNNPNWNATKSFPMAPVGNKKYQVYLVGGVNLNVSNVNFKFFDAGGVFNEYFNNSSEERIVSQTSYFSIPATDGNIRAGSGLKSGETYILTIDASSIPVILTAEVDE